MEFHGCYRRLLLTLNLENMWDDHNKPYWKFRSWQMYVDKQSYVVLNQEVIFVR